MSPQKKSWRNQKLKTPRIVKNLKINLLKIKIPKLPRFSTCATDKETKEYDDFLLGKISDLESKLTAALGRIATLESELENTLKV